MKTRLSFVAGVLFPALLTIMLSAATAWAGVRDVKVSLDEFDRLVVTYELVGPPNAEYLVRMSVSLDGGKTYNLTPRSVSGDIGPGVIPGSKKIVWDVFRDMPKLVADELVVQVTADPSGVGWYGTAERESSPKKAPSHWNRQRVYRTIGYTALGVGVASLAAGGYFLYRSNQAYDDFQNAADQDEEDDAKNRGKNAEMIGFAGLGLGVAASAAAVTFLLLGREPRHTFYQKYDVIYAHEKDHHLFGLSIRW